jgi:hypothetical protein
MELLPLTNAPSSCTRLAVLHCLSASSPVGGYIVVFSWLPFPDRRYQTELMIERWTLVCVMRDTGETTIWTKRSL